MKKLKVAAHSIASLVLIASTFFPVAPMFMGHAAAFSGDGEGGSSGNPYRLTACEQLQEIDDNLSAYYAIMNDIDCSGSASWNDGAGFSPIGLIPSGFFSGHLDGRNHTISGLTINKPAAHYLGLFSNLNNATVKNLNLTDVSVIGYGHLGALAGTVSGATTVSNVNVQGSIDGDETYIGGLIGSLWNGVTVNKVSFTGTVDGLQGVGGLAGEDLGAQISDSYANATVTATAVAGGLVGFMGFGGNDASIVRSYMVGSVSGSYKGGVVGITQGSGELGVTDSFTVVSTTGGSAFAGWDGDNPLTLTGNFFDQTVHDSDYCVSGNSGVTGCTAVNTDGEGGGYFKGNNTNAPLDGWDFDNVWQIADGAYPTLRPGVPDTLDPISYTVTNCDELQAMQDDLTGSYALGNNIDCSATSGWNDGEGFVPVGTDDNPFTGSLNGAGHRISGLYINREADDQGLFGVIENGGVASLFMRGGSVQGLNNTGAVAGRVRGTSSVQQTASDVTVTGTGHFGGLVGLTQDSALLQYVAAMGDASGDGTVSPVSAGGVVGRMDDNSFLVNGYASGTITVTTAGDNFVGGVAGMVHDAGIANAYFSGAVHVPVSSLGFATAGGLVGVLDGGELNNSFNAGAVTGYALNGGLVGMELDASSVTGLYLDVSRTGFETCFGYSDGGNLTEGDCAKLNAVDDNAEYFFNNSSNAPLDQWDFGGVWQSLQNGFPIFTWQPIPGAYELDHQYTITTCSQLQSINEDLDGDYVLGADIDCSATVTWNDGEGFSPIGLDAGDFTGSFDGDGYTISNVYIDRPDTYSIGLFATAVSPNIHDVTLEGFVVHGYYYTGALVGNLSVGEAGGAIEGVTVTSASIVGVQDVGGLVGYLYASDNAEHPFYLRDNSVLGGEVSDSEPSGNVGGMIGYLTWGRVNMVMTNNDSSIDVYAPDSYGVGGLFGFIEQWAYSDVTMRDLSASGEVTGYDFAGGLIGEIRSYLGDGVDVSKLELLSATAEGAVHGYDVGGLVGILDAQNGMTISIRDSHTSNDIDTDNAYVNIGGLVGGISGDDYSVFIRQSYTSGSVFNESGGAGGLVGYSDDAISYIIDSVSMGDVSGYSGIGGLLGSGKAIIYNSYAVGTVTAENGTVGGLVGYMHGGRIQNSFSAVAVASGPETEFVAGLIGLYDSTVTLVGNGYDREVSGATECAYFNNGEEIVANDDEDECAQRNGENSTPNWFKNNHTNAPLDEWNFDDIWETIVGDYPALAEQPATQAPGAVRNLQATGSKTNLQLSWNAPANTGGTGIVGYTVWASVHGWDWWQPIGFTTGTSFAVSEDDLSDGMIYDFRVFAINETDLSAAAAESDYFMGTRYSISTCEDLQAMADDDEGDYTLTGDIDCSDSVNWNEGTGFVPIVEFYGQLHGAGHTISGLYINRPDVDRQGLFGDLYDDARVEDLRLADGSITGGTSVGVIAAGISGQSIIRRVSSNLDVTGFLYAGGLVGEASDAITIQNSYATGDVFATMGSSGGLVGYASGNDSVIEFTYATGDVTALTDEFGADFVGGLVGLNDGANIRHSFATGHVTPAAGYDDYASGLVGYDYDEGTRLAGNYYNADNSAACEYGTVSGPMDTADCVGISLANHPNYFFGNHTSAPLDTWDFDDVWQTVASGYPVLRGQGHGSGGDDTDDGDVNHTTGNTSGGTKKFVATVVSAATDVLQNGAAEADDSELVLDDFKEYTDGKGKALTLHVGQVIHFTVVRGGRTEHHTATVKEVGDDYVVFTIHSTTFDVTVAVGETKTVVIDGTGAIKIKVVGIDADGQVNVFFSKIRTSVSTQKADGGYSWWWLAATLVALGSAWALARHVRHGRAV